MAKKNSEIVLKQYQDSGYGRWLMDDAPEAREVAEALELMRATNTDIWRGTMAIPPNSFIEALASTFRQHSSIAIELPIMSAFAYLASYLCQNDIKYILDDREDYPTLWIAMLASSGAGKTTVLDYIEEALGGNVATLGESIASARMFVEKLAETPNALWIKDEMGPFFANAKEQSYLSELPEYLLHIYTHKQIDRSTTRAKLVVDNPVLNVLGMSASGSFFDDFDPKHFLSGLAQRFCWVFVDKEPKSKALWHIREPDRIAETKARWDRIVSELKPGMRYHIPRNGSAEQAFSIAWDLLNPGEENMPDSFFRRMMHGGAIRYAVLYHILLGKAAQPEIDQEDIAWAARLAYLHVCDTRKILEYAKLGKVGAMLDKVEKLGERIRRQHNRELTARDIARNINAVRTAGEAKQLLELYQQRESTR